ncbi:hypothetical protein PISMIDRAFT_14801, partial [Pisolithus microcarpus 441]
MPDSTQALWCVCRKYCKGVRRPINTLRTWKRHLREADDDEKTSITLATRSDAFRAFIVSSARSGDASGETGTAKCPRLTPAAEHRPRLPDQGDGHQSEVHDYHRADDDQYFHNDDGPGEFRNDNGLGEFRNDDGPGEFRNDDGPG